MSTRKTAKQSDFQELWETLSQLNCDEHTENAGRFKYLTWSWAWKIFMEHCPQARYVIHDDLVFPDQSREVRVSISVEIKGETIERMMWLPVMNSAHKAIFNPNSYEINTARMRCLTKCMAMFGLGHYIYAGEDLPAVLKTWQKKEIDKLVREAQIKGNFTSEDWKALRELTGTQELRDCPPEKYEDLINSLKGTSVPLTLPGLTDEQKKEIDEAVKEAEESGNFTDEDWSKLYKWQHVENIHDIQPEHFDNVIKGLNKIRDREKETTEKSEK